MTVYQKKITPEMEHEIVARFDGDRASIEPLAVLFDIPPGWITRVLRRNGVPLDTLHGKKRPPKTTPEERLVKLAEARSRALELKRTTLTDAQLDRIVAIAYYLRKGYSHRQIGKMTGRSGVSVTLFIGRYPEAFDVVMRRLDEVYPI